MTVGPFFVIGIKKGFFHLTHKSLFAIHSGLYRVWQNRHRHTRELSRVLLIQQSNARQFPNTSPASGHDAPREIQSSQPVSKLTPVDKDLGCHSPLIGFYPISLVYTAVVLSSSGSTHTVYFIAFSILVVGCLPQETM